MKPPSAPMPATLVAACRYFVGIAVPFAVSRGWIAADSVEGVSGLIVAGATVIYGLWKTHDRQTRLNDAAPIGRSTIRSK